MSLWLCWCGEKSPFGTGTVCLTGSSTLVPGVGCERHAVPRPVTLILSCRDPNIVTGSSRRAFSQQQFSALLATALSSISFSAPTLYLCVYFQYLDILDIFPIALKKLAFPLHWLFLLWNCSWKIQLLLNTKYFWSTVPTLYMFNVLLGFDQLMAFWLDFKKWWLSSSRQLCDDLFSLPRPLNVTLCETE